MNAELIPLRSFELNSFPLLNSVNMRFGVLGFWGFGVLGLGLDLVGEHHGLLPHSGDIVLEPG